MRDVVLMWRSRRMIGLTILVTIVFSAILLPFKELAVLPGFSSIRPANVIPIVAGLLFGPAGAWGSMFGNVIGDLLGGTWTAGSYFGAIGNFFTAFISYRLWGNLGSLSTGREPDMRSGTQFPEFVVVTVAAACITAAIIGWGHELVGLLPFAIIGGTIVFNNSLGALFLGPPLLYVLYLPVKERGWLYHQILDADSLPARHPRQRRAAIALLGLSIAWFVLGMTISIALDGVSFRSVLEFELVTAAGSTAQLAVGTGMFGLVVLASWLAGERLSSLDTSGAEPGGTDPADESTRQPTGSNDPSIGRPLGENWNIGLLAITGLGIVLTALYTTTVLASFVTGSRPFDIVLYQLGIGLPLPVGLIVAAGWLGRTGFSTERIWKITIWTFGGLGLVTIISVWQFSYVFLGVSLTGNVMESFFLNVQAGAAIGFVVGLYDARAESASDALDETREKYSTLGEKTHDGVAIVQDGVFTFVNPQMVTLLGRDKSDLLGRPMTDVVAPEYRETVRERYRARTADGSPPEQYEIEVLTPAEKRRYVDIQVKRIRSEGRPASLITAKDITDWKNLEDRLREQRDNVELLNQVLRHDIMSEVNFIMQVAAHDGDDTDGGRTYSDQLLESGTRILDLLEATQELMNAVSGVHTEREPISLTPLLEREVMVATDQFPDAEIRLDTPIPDVEALAHETLESVLRNLLSNAIAHNDSETPTVDVSVEETPSEVIVRVADNGPGIPDDRTEEIFEPDVGSGDTSTSGLGLYLVGSLINRFGGDLWVEDNEPRGSVFAFTLETAASD